MRQCVKYKKIVNPSSVYFWKYKGTSSRTVGNGDPMQQVCIYVATFNWNNPSNWDTS